MNKKIVAFGAFILGFAGGWVAANKALRDQYEAKIQDEIKSVMEVMDSKRDKKKTVANKTQTNFDPRDKVSIETMSNEPKRNYAKLSSPYKTETPTPDKKINSPYIISDQDFGSLDYEEIELHYFPDDDVMTDDEYEVMNSGDIQNDIGRGWIKRFGEYSEDTVYVRNEKLKADFEIQREEGSYNDFLAMNPHIALRQDRL